MNGPLTFRLTKDWTVQMTQTGRSMVAVNLILETGWSIAFFVTVQFHLFGSKLGKRLLRRLLQGFEVGFSA